jgi:hypothetical protein
MIGLVDPAGALALNSRRASVGEQVGLVGNQLEPRRLRSSKFTFTASPGARLHDSPLTRRTNLVDSRRVGA